ncbi:MAG: alkyl hydroperoxide reductase subunit F [Lysobacterales bacterium]
MLDAALKAQLQGYLEKLRTPIDLVATLDDGPTSAELASLLEEIAGLSEQVAYRTDGQAERAPSFEIQRRGSDHAVAFAGVPLGHEFTSLVLALLQIGGHPPKVDEAVLEQIQALSGEYRFETYYSLSCQNCPDVVQALNLLAAVNPAIHHTAIDGAAFQDEVAAREIMAVPSVYLNGQPFASGRMSVEEILAKLDSGGAERAAQALNDREDYDVLVVGGGPAGAAAAIYAARKGIRTGLVAERFGGQVMDTLGIENFISVPHTEGPKLVAALEQHVRDYAVDLITGQQAQGLRPAAQTGHGLHELQLASGATLRSRSIVLATGARWRQMGVPGEDEYRNKGVAYCPHCDGPLFKGKRVAVIGGGNSGVEAAIDLAGLVREVTLIEFDGQLRADEVLQRKLRSLSNVRVVVSAQTTEVTGDGRKVTGLNYRDRATGEVHQLELEGVFVQIGLLPNSDWLRDTLTLSPRGEIVVDGHGQTSVEGVFAAGDVTTVPYKQIIIAMGEGSKAALAAFDHLIRNDVAMQSDAQAA